MQDAHNVRTCYTPPVVLKAHVLHRRLVLGIFAAALVLRLAFIFYFDTWRISPETDHWAFGYETGRVARSLAEGHGFASPFQEPTGPTAWLAPGYPWLLSLLFLIFGVYSPASAMAALVINGLFSAVTCLVVFRLGRAFYDETTGLLGAALFALSPASIWHTITSIWDVTLGTLLLALLVSCLRRLQFSLNLKLAAVTGVMAGMLALVNPTCLTVYVAGVAWICFQERRHPRLLLGVCTVLAGVPALLCLPWMVRNQLVLHQFSIKSNFGTELRIGNNPLAPASPGTDVMDLHPTHTEFAIYRKLGEPGYVAWCQREAITFIRQNPTVFLKLVARRVLVFWTGVQDNNFKGNLKTGVHWSAMKRLIMGSWALLALLGLAAGFRARDHMLLLLMILAYPLPYYLTHATNRYRLPLEPVLMVLSAHGLIWVWQRWQAARLRRH